jgi:hypothetical protein
VLLTLPNKKSARIDELDDQIAQLYARKPRGSANFATAEDNRLFGELTAERNKLIKNENSYKSSHWDEPNILAHVRMNDRNIDGKKSLHLEEIQSDWHQQGRDKGYTNKGELEQVKKDYDSYEKDLFKRAKDAFYKDASESGVPTDRVDRIYEKTLKSEPSWKQSQYLGEDEVVKHKQLWDDYQLKQAELSNKVPDAPFKKSWHELALKRMLREAAEKGYDRLSWTPGEAQAARYDLSKQIDQIKYIKNPDGTYNVVPFKSNSPVHSIERENVKAADLSGIVGKEVAEKITKGQGKKEGDIGVLEGLDLKIGGEGHSTRWLRGEKKCD